MATTTTPRTDPDEIIRAVKVMTAIGHGGITELRALNATVNGDRRAMTYSGYFNDAEKLADEAERITSADGVYVIPNEIDLRLLARAKNAIHPSDPKRRPSTADKDITARHFLLIDCDAVRPAGISASDEEHEAALYRADMIRYALNNIWWPMPLYADSGNGGHLKYLIEGVGTLEDDELIKRCLEALHAEYGDEAVKIDTSVHNAARIWKLPGTFACKGDDTDDRPHRMARLLDVPANWGQSLVTREQLEELAAKAPKTEQPKSQPYQQNGGFDLERFIAHNLPDAKGPDNYNGGSRWILPVCPFNADHTRGEAFVIKRAEGPIQAGCQHESCKWRWHDLRAKYEPKQQREKPLGNDFGDESCEFTLMTSAELDAANYRTDFLVDWTLVAGQPCVFAGAKKTLKTSLLVELGISLACGGEFLGKLRVPHAVRVAMMSGESGMATIQETARRIADTHGKKLAELANLFWCDRLPHFSNVMHLDALDAMLKQDAIQVLIVDPAYLCMDGDDAGNLFKMGRILRGINDVCSANAVTLVIAHHTKRGGVDQLAPAELEDISWAGFQEYARQWFLTSRREKYQPGTGQHRLWLTVGGSAGHSALWALDVDEGTLPNRKWEVSMMHADEARKDVDERREADKEAKKREKLERDIERVVRAMTKFPAGETKSVIRQTSGLKPDPLKDALSELLLRGDAMPVQLIKGNHKTPIEGYRLCDQT